MPGRNKADQELTTLLTKLYTIQEELGAKPKSSDEEKKKKAAANSATMGKGKAASKTGTRFLELKSGIVERLQTVHGLLQEQAERESGKMSVAAGNNPKEVIAAQAEMREQIRQMQVDWEELDKLYKNEAKKKRSKFTASELEIQQTLVLRLQEEIETVKSAQSKGYTRGGTADLAATLNTKALADLDAKPLFGSEEDGGGGGAPAASLTDDQRLQLQQIEDRDAAFDDQLDTIGAGIEDLAEIAALQAEEVKRQNVMLDNLGNRIDNVHERVQNVNAKMKDTLNEVGRSSEKLCIDIMCIILALGFAAVFYNMAKKSGAL